MNTLIIDQRGAILSHQSGALVVRVRDQKPRTIPLNLVSRLVLSGAVQIDSALLSQFAERGISLVAMPGRGNRRAAFLYGIGHGDAARRLRQYQLVLDPSVSTQWARRFISLKIAGGIRLLRHALELRPDARYPLTSGLNDLGSALGNVRIATTTETLRGMEGAASARFFAAYRALFPESLDFTTRNRRPPRDPVNAALSLGYTLLHADALRALVASGMDPMLGFLHEPAYGRESLACDLVEIARPRVDHMVWRLFAERQLSAERFTNDNGACRINKQARAIFFGSFEKQAHLHRKWFQRYARALAATCSVASAAVSPASEDYSE